jgi:hypothetical protein
MSRKVLIYEEDEGEYSNYLKVWMERYTPSLLPYFDTVSYPMPRTIDVSKYAVGFFLIKDVVRGPCYEQALQLANSIETVINHPKYLDNSRKLNSSVLMRQVVRTPVMTEVVNFTPSMNYPYIIREDNHGGIIRIVKKESDIGRLNLRAMFRPICCEFIDTCRDGWYRKYRYIAAGDNGISYHMQTSKKAIVKRNVTELNDETRSLEIDYISKPDPNHTVFQKLRDILHFDFFALDYGYLNDEVVVWEVNVHPNIGPKPILTYNVNGINRTTKCMIEMCIKHIDPQLVSVLEDGFADCMARDERKY